MRENEKIDRYIVGKWYRSIDSNGWKKFLKEDTDKWYYSEEIYRYYESKNFTLRTYCNDYVSLPFRFDLLTDLTEIQQYLPDGHVDKLLNRINELEKDNYVLPEYWCIERTEDTADEINAFFRRPENNKQKWYYLSRKGYLSFDYINSDKWKRSSPVKPKAYTELTFEQFKKYVMKENNNMDSVPDIPEYVECIKSKSNSYELGKIYMVDQKTGNVFTRHASSKWNNTNDYQSKFKISTKEAYNAQNNTFKVNKGDYLYCHTELKMDDCGTVEAIYGKCYKSERNNCFTNESGDDNHGVGDNPEKWFSKTTKSYYDACQTNINNISQFTQKYPIKNVMTDDLSETIKKYSDYGWVAPLVATDSYNESDSVTHNNLIKILYTKPRKKDVLPKKSKTLKFLNVTQIKIN